MTLLATLVEVSDRVGATPARLAKVRELAAFLRSLEPAEIPIGVQYLSGETAQGRFGLGYSALKGAGTDPPADTSSLSLAEVDRSIGEIAALHGTRVGARRAPAL